MEISDGGKIENKQTPQKEVTQSLITNNFFELSESSSVILISILSNLALYDSNFNFRNFQLEMHLELTRIDAKFFEAVLGSLTGGGHKMKMLKFYDFISYDFKRLRTKYEEMNESFFDIDEENKYVVNIRSIMLREHIKPSKLGCCYLRLVNYYLKKIDKRLKSFYVNNFHKTEEENEKYIFAVKIY